MVIKLVCTNTAFAKEAVMKKVPLILKIILPILVIGIIVLATMNMAEKPVILASGELHIKPGLEDYASANRTLFIVIYDNNEANKMPLGIIKEPIKITGPGYIRKFSITPDKVQRMMSNAPIPNVFKLKSRLDRDGMGGPDKAGDVVSITENVSFGSETVIINFDTKI